MTDEPIRTPAEAGADDVERVAQAIADSKAVDDEGPFQRLGDLLDFSGENKTRTVCRAAARAALAAMRPATAEGWRLVPVEPTPEMIRAAMTAFVERKDVAKHGADKAITRAEWAAMLAAAPAHGGRDE